MFYGESMFSEVSDASKIALVAIAMQLKAWGFILMDTQVETPHLKSMGARPMSRKVFEALLQTQTQRAFPAQKWQMEIDWFQAAIQQAHYQQAIETPSQ